MKDKDINSLDHTRWRCQYYVVFAPKYRRMAIYGEIKVDIGKILRQLCKQKGIEIIEAELCQDHVHMLISIPPKCSVSQIMGYLKGKSSLMIFDRHANLKYKYGNRHFWCRGYSNLQAVCRMHEFRQGIDQNPADGSRKCSAVPISGFSVSGIPLGLIGNVF